MADGLQDAARAFQTEIAPASERPRDDGGRFTSTGKPESLFSPRPIEGDPLTGDTRDAGEDPRLAERERRHADGWSEKGDGGAGQSRRVSDGAAGAGHAGSEDGHAGPEAGQQAGGDDESEQHDPDGEGSDAGQGPDGSSGEKWQVTLNGQPVEKFEVTVGDETKAVTFDEAIKGYMDGAEYTQRREQVERERASLREEAQTVAQARDAYAQQLDFVGRVLTELYPQEPNWDQEFAADPRAAHEKQKMFGFIKSRMQGVAQAMQQETQQRQRAYDQEVARYAEWGKEEFKRRSGIADQATLNNEFSAMRRAGLEHYGFTDQELATVYDPRMLAVLHDASRYRRMMANKPRPIAPEKGRTLAPGAAKPLNGVAARRSIDDALKRQASNGSIDATAAVFERLIR